MDMDSWHVRTCTVCINVLQDETVQHLDLPWYHDTNRHAIYIYLPYIHQCIGV